MVWEALEEAKKECTGCGACYNICPVNAIKMIPDTEGFFKPEIDGKTCIHCNRCADICPQVHYERRNDDNPSCYAVQASDEIRMASSSGGVFSVLADYIFERGGYVCGAAYDTDLRGVSMIMIHDRSEMEKLRGSKYVYAKPGSIYAQVKEKLKQNAYVLFSGTPCQVAALNKYLGGNYDTLITVDILCGGTPPEKIYRMYVDELSERGKVEKISFRCKKYGWDYYGIEYTYEDGTTHFRPLKDPYFKDFVKWLYVGKACAECTFAAPARPGDFSMGDFWQIEKVLPDLDVDKGVSCLLVNNQKSREMYEEIKDNFKFRQDIPLAFLKRHNRLQEKRAHHLARTRFFNLISKGVTFSKAVDYSLGWKFDIALTGCWTVKNYGGEITYYALYNTLKDMGYETIMAERRADIPGYDVPRPSLFYDNPYPFYDVSRIHKNFQDQWELNNRVRCFMCGSDQIWNYSVMQEEAVRSYTMDYVADWRKKITYASSFGCNYIKGDENQVSELTNLIKRLNCISVREKEGCNICEKIGVAAEWVLDPVFLCDPEVYKILMDKARGKSKGEYLFSYFVNPNKGKYGIDILAQKLGYGYVGIVSGSEADLKKWGFSEKKWPYPYMNYVKVEDWLYNLAHSQFIVTDSFHAICMAIIFRKPFLFTQGRMTEQYGFGRISSLLEHLGLMERVVDTVEVALRDDNYLTPIDYDSVYKILEKEIERSKKWLRDAIEA